MAERAVSFAPTGLKSGRFCSSALERLDLARTLEVCFQAGRTKQHDRRASWPCVREGRSALVFEFD